jgi:hypothetical protein
MHIEHCPVVACLPTKPGEVSYVSFSIMPWLRLRAQLTTGLPAGMMVEVSEAQGLDGRCLGRLVL